MELQEDISIYASFLDLVSLNQQPLVVFTLHSVIAGPQFDNLRVNMRALLGLPLSHYFGIQRPAMCTWSRKTKWKVEYRVYGTNP